MRDHFLKFRVRIVPIIGEILQTKTSFMVGSALMTTLGEKDERWLHGFTCETTRTMIDGNQDLRSVLGQNKGHTGHLKSQRTD
jgi:hypothetical protein